MKEQKNRNYKIYSAKEAGKTYRTLSREYDLTEDRIFQIVKDVRVKIALEGISIKKS